MLKNPCSTLTWCYEDQLNTWYNAWGLLGDTIVVWRERRMKKQYPKAPILRKALEIYFRDVTE